MLKKLFHNKQRQLPYRLNFIFLHLPDMENPITDRKVLYSFMMLFILVVIMVVCLQLMQALVEYTLPSFFGVSDGHAFLRSAEQQIKNPLASLYAQALCSSIGFFLLPVILYHIIFRYDMASSMGLKALPSARYWLAAIGVMFMAGIFIQWLVQINAAIPLPDKWQALRTAQQETDKLVNSFFSDRGPTRFMLLTLVMCLLPAMGEEVCFRGTIQKTLYQTNLGPTGAIILSGLFFSIIHTEFNNFLAIWCMGIVLGCLYYYSGTIWTSIAAHFFNNLTNIAGHYAYMRGVIHSDVVNTNTLPLYITLPAGAMMIYGLVLMRRWSGKNVKSGIDGLPSTSDRAGKTTPLRKTGTGPQN
jgi:membrane protease YdiL (CAAX protease family)